MRSDPSLTSDLPCKRRNTRHARTYLQHRRRTMMSKSNGGSICQNATTYGADFAAAPPAHMLNSCVVRPTSRSHSERALCSWSTQPRRGAKKRRQDERHRRVRTFRSPLSADTANTVPTVGFEHAQRGHEARVVRDPEHGNGEQTISKHIDVIPSRHSTTSECSSYSRYQCMQHH